MEKRYKNMSKIGVRDLEGYNKKIEREGVPSRQRFRIGFDEKTGKPNYHNEEITLKKMPFIVVIVDEMADLMAVAGKEIDHSVVTTWSYGKISWYSSHNGNTKAVN